MKGRGEGEGEGGGVRGRDDAVQSHRVTRGGMCAFHFQC